MVITFFDPGFCNSTHIEAMFSEINLEISSFVDNQVTVYGGTFISYCFAVMFVWDQCYIDVIVLNNSHDAWPILVWVLLTCWQSCQIALFLPDSFYMVFFFPYIQVSDLTSDPYFSEKRWYLAFILALWPISLSWSWSYFRTMYTVAMVRRHTDKRASANLSPVRFEWLNIMVFSSLWAMQSYFIH